MPRKQPKKPKEPLLKLPPSFFIGEDLWKVEYKWRLVDSAGERQIFVVDPDRRVITFDHMASMEEKAFEVLAAFALATISNRVLLSEASLLVAADLRSAILQNFKIRWKRSNDR